MRQKELRIALVCYGGISLAVYMHGVTKELWRLARASRAYHDHPAPPAQGVEAVYLDLFRHIETQHALRLRVLPDIIAGASAGGINGVFLAQAIHSGQSLEPLTELWLARADVDVLLDPDARLITRFFKFWAVPLVRLALSRPGNVVSANVSPGTRSEVRGKLSRLVRSRWFHAPFGGMGFSRLLAEALDAMAASPSTGPLLPPGHPVDLFVTATDFKGHKEVLKLHSPPQAEESEHRVSIGFHAPTPQAPGASFAPLIELVFAARATASFPGAFPSLQPAEIDRLARERGDDWPSRTAFLTRALPAHVADGTAEHVALIDGSVLVNAPFAEAMAVLPNRPAQREVDRRFVYIDPRPDRVGGLARQDPRPPGWFSVIFGSLSSIPREQPVRDNLEDLARQSREMERLSAIVAALRPEVEQAVEHVFGHTLFLDNPTPRRLAGWRDKAQTAAAHQSGYAYHGYAQIKLAGTIEALAALICAAAPALDLQAVQGALSAHLAATGLAQTATQKSTLSSQAIAFFRDHDLAHRIRRLRLLSRRLAGELDKGDDLADPARQAARDGVYRALSLYFDREGPAIMGPDFATIAAQALSHPGSVLAVIAERRKLAETDLAVDAILAEVMAATPAALRRRVLLTYLGFPFYDVVTLPLLRGEGLSEFEPVKVDRISPDDAPSIRRSGANGCLRGVEFFNFGAFFSRAYRENDYLWGRLHGAERMIDLVASALPAPACVPAEVLAGFKRRAFLAVLDEEEARLTADPALVAGIRQEVLAAGERTAAGVPTPA